MKKFVKVLFAVVAVVCACSFATASTYAYDGDFIRTSDGEPVGSEIQNSPVYQSNYNERSHLTNSFYMIALVVLAGGVVGALVSHAANKDRRNTLERQLDLQEREVVLQEKRFAAGDTSAPIRKSSRPVTSQVDNGVSGTPASSLMGSVGVASNFQQDELMRQQMHQQQLQGQDLNIPFQSNMF